MKKYYVKHIRLFLFTIILTVAANFFSNVPGSLVKKNLVDSALSTDPLNIGKYLLILILLRIIASGMYIFACAMQNRFCERVTYDIRCDVFSGILSRNLKDFRAVNTADYLSAITNDLSNIRNQSLGLVFFLAYSICGLLFSSGLMIYYEPFVGIVSLILGCTMAVVPILLSKRKQLAEKTRSKALAALTTAANDFFSGFEVIFSFGIQKIIVQKFLKPCEDLYRDEYKADNLESVIDSTAQLFSSIAQALILGLGCWMVYQGRMTYGSLTAFISLNTVLCSNLSVVLRLIPILKGISPVVKRITDLADYPSYCGGSIEFVPLENGVSVRDLSFEYVTGSPVLDCVSFDLEAGKKYALIGESGSGKTTLIRLLMGEYDDYAGNIYYDSVNIRSVNRSALYKTASLIHQEVFLFDDTIRNNICLFEAFSDDDFVRAINLSGVYKFINTLPGGTEYRVGEMGSRLSGGQRQRIAIARAIIRNTRLLILDEGTSALDIKNASDIEEELFKIPDLTLLTITHNLREDSKYDEIFEIRNKKMHKISTTLPLV